MGYLRLLNSLTPPSLSYPAVIASMFVVLHIFWGLIAFKGWHVVSGLVTLSLSFSSHDTPSSFDSVQKADMRRPAWSDWRVLFVLGSHYLASFLVCGVHHLSTICSTARLSDTHSLPTTGPFPFYRH